MSIYLYIHLNLFIYIQIFLYLYFNIYIYTHILFMYLYECVHFWAVCVSLYVGVRTSPGICIYYFVYCIICSTSLSGGNQVDGLPPASSDDKIYKFLILSRCHGPGALP